MRVFYRNMPALNYEILAERAKQRLLQDELISEKNKIYVRQFIKSYHTSKARQQIVFAHLRHFLQKSNDIKIDMHSKDVMNRIYYQLLKEKPSYFETIRNVSRMFTTRLNNDVPVDALVNVLKKFPRKPNKRDLDREDMISWDDGLKFINGTNNLQLKGIIAMQLDAGLRPSEFVDLDFGDIERKQDFIVIKVKGGKTGKREVPSWRCVPHILRWLHNHPTKKNQDPLWLLEIQINGSYKRYDYRAMQKRVKELAKKVGIKQPVDFYSLRHSSCFLDKVDNIPLDIAADRHGHSVKYFLEIYGKLTIDDTINRIKKHNGGEAIEKKKAEQNINCSRCNFVNDPETEICEKCGAALTVKKAIEIDKSKSSELISIKKSMEKMRKKLEAKNKKDEFIFKIIKGLIKKGKIDDAVGIVHDENLENELSRLTG